MQRKLTITVDGGVYMGLHRLIGLGKISRFIEALVRPRVLEPDMKAAYRRMAADKVREAEAFDWAEATVADIADETR